MYLPVWTYQRRHPAAQLLGVFICFVWEGPTLLWCCSHLPSLHTRNVGCFSRWKQKVISLSPKWKVLFVPVLLLIDWLIDWFSYIFNTFNFYLSSTVLVTMPFLKVYLWLKTVQCLDLWTWSRKLWKRQVWIVIWQNTSVAKINISIQHRFPPQLQLLPAN